MNEKGLALLKSFEGCRLKAYRDIVGVLTIGYGHTGPDVQPGLTWTQDQVDECLEQDLGRFVSGVEALLEDDVTENQLAALVCFAYNVGLGALTKSHLLSKLNEGDVRGAADEFLRWNHAGGQVDAGLTRRREAERTLFLS